MAKPDGKKKSSNKSNRERKSEFTKAGRHSKSGGKNRGQGKDGDANTPIAFNFTARAEILYHSPDTKIDERDLLAIQDGVLGVYGIKTEEGVIVVECFDCGGKPSIKVLASTVTGVSVAEYFLYCYLLEREHLQQVTGEYIFRKQLALFDFLKSNLPKKPKVVNVTSADVVSIATGRAIDKKEQVKIARRAEAARVDLPRQVAVKEMQRSTITLHQAIAGSMGNIVLNGDGNHMAILQHYVVGADHLVKAMHLSDEHPLRKDGCIDTLDGKATFVYVGQVRNGEVRSTDYYAERFSELEVKAKNALIGFLRQQLALVGLNLKPTLIAKMQKSA